MARTKKESLQDAHLWTLELFLSECRRLKRESDKASRAFIEFLQRGEQAKHIWSALASTYDEFLRAEDIYPPRQYRDAVRALQVIAPVDVETIGVTAAVRAVRITDADMRATIVESMKVVAAHNGAPLSTPAVNQICKAHGVVVGTKRLDDYKDRIEALRKENEALRLELDETKAKLAKASEALAKAKAETAAKRQEIATMRSNANKRLNDLFGEP